MNFFKNLKPIQLYMSSVVFFVLSNLVKKEHHNLYVLFLVIGIVVFFLGLRTRIKK